MAVNKLVIAVAHTMIDHPKIQELREKGHEIVPQDFRAFHLILDESAHFWNDMMWDFLPAALTAARKRKKERA